MKAPVRIVTLLGALVAWLLVSASTAVADAPVSDDWPAPPERSVLDILLLFGGGTVGLFVLVTLLGMLLSRNNYVPPDPSTDLQLRGDRSPAQH